MEKLEGKVFVVAGADNSVGRAVVACIAAEGARVVALERDHNSFTGNDAQEWNATFAAVAAKHGSISGFINARQIVNRRSIGQIAAGDFQTNFDQNAEFSWLGQQAAILALRQFGGGVIINITSVLARVAASDCAALCAAARGILMSTKSAALECARAKDNIIVSAVLAGRIEGDSDHWPDGRILADAPVVSADEVAAGARFLASDGAAYMTGVELPVDRGFLAS